MNGFHQNVSSTIIMFQYYCTTNLIQVTCFYNTIEKWLSEIYEEAEIDYNDEWKYQYIPNEWNHPEEAEACKSNREI